MQLAMPRPKTLQRCGLVVVVATAVAPAVLWALPIEQIPNPRKIQGNWVSDVANILRPETESQLNALINQQQAANGDEIAIVTVPDSAPYATPKQLATSLFNSWGIGRKGKDNGLLVLISVGNRRVEIETGYGLEAILPDAKVGRIIAEQVTPAFKQGNFDAGTLSGTRAIVQALQGSAGPNSLTAGKIAREGSDSAKRTRSGDRTTTPLLRGTGSVEVPGSDNQPISSRLTIGIIFLIFVPAFSLIVGYCGSYFLAGHKYNLAESLQGLLGLFYIHGLGQSIRLSPRQPSRVKAWHLKFETNGAMRCAVCGAALEPVNGGDVNRNLNKKEKAAIALGNLQIRGWRCSHCAPEAMHLRGYESTSHAIERCPKCHELTVTCEAPRVIPNPSLLGPDVQIINCHCMACDYTVQRQKPTSRPWYRDGISSIDGGWSLGGGSDCGGGGDFGGGSSGGGGAGGDW